MIVYDQNESIHIVTQVDHAKLSGTINEKLIPVDLPSSVHSAIEHHDDGWSDWDENPGLKQGRPIDYRSMPLKDHIPILRNSIASCEQIHPYAGWLVSQHGCSFHQSKSARLAKKFLRNEQKRRERILDSNELPDPQCRSRHFDILQFCDALSLFAISPWNGSWDWNRDNPGPFSVDHVEKGTFTVKSDWLSDSVYTFTVPVTSIPDKQYESRDEFSETLTMGIKSEKTIRLISD